MVAYGSGVAVLPQPPFDARELEKSLRRIPTMGAGRPHAVLDDPVSPRVVYEGRGFVPLRRLLSVSELTTREVGVLGSEICGHLETLQEAGLSHGALTLDSVALDHYQRVRLLETGFGARSRSRSGERVLFQSDERIDGGKPSTADDVFALGVILFHCCAGASPFPGERIGRSPRTLDEAVPFSDFPSELGKLIDMMLQGSSAGRPSLDVVREVLEQLAERSRSDRVGRALLERESGFYAKGANSPPSAPPVHRPSARAPRSAERGSALAHRSEASEVSPDRRAVVPERPKSPAGTWVIVALVALIALVVAAILVLR